MIPVECHMPELGNLERLVDRLLLRVMMDGRVRDKREHSIERNFVRLVDKAVRAYGAARAAMIMQIEDMNRLREAASRMPYEGVTLEGSSLPALGFTDHFEDCITATNRLLKLLESIKAAKMPVVREVRVIIDAYSKEIPGLRNMIEHIAEEISKGAFKDGQFIMLAPTVDGSSATLGSNRIAFADLKILLRRLHDVASTMLSVPMEFANLPISPLNGKG
jgi:hypothetical protein